jgi:four helix bundle protein
VKTADSRRQTADSRQQTADGRQQTADGRRQNVCNRTRGCIHHLPVPYRDLVVWQKAMNLAEVLYRETAEFPIEERYGLTAQMRRAAVSVPSNIAEGQGRRSSDDELVRFLQIALGSLCELETQLELSVRLHLLSTTQMNRLRPLTDEVGRLINGLIRSKR